MKSQLLTFTLLIFVFSTNGTVYFRREESEDNSFDILSSKLVNGSYTEPENLGSPVNTEFFEAAPFIAPDERTVAGQSQKT